MLVNRDFLDFECEGDIPNISFLVGTAGQGLLYFYDGSFVQIASAESVYGISRFENDWYYLADDHNSGGVYSVELRGAGGFNFRRRIKGMHKGAHQIDFVRHLLYVVNTHTNVIFVYKHSDFSKGVMSYKGHIAKIAPNGLLSSQSIKRGGTHRYNQPQYGHFNSIFASENEIVLLAHNVTTKTGRLSQVYHLNKKRKVAHKYEIDGYNCHNVYSDTSRLIICDSARNRVVDYQNNDVLFGCPKFTRGLALSVDYVLVGGSMYNNSDASERFAEGSVYILDSKFKQIGEVKIKGCQVHEVRRVDAPDKCLSNTGLKWK